MRDLQCNALYSLRCHRTSLLHNDADSAVGAKRFSSKSQARFTLRPLGMVSGSSSPSWSRSEFRLVCRTKKCNLRALTARWSGWRSRHLDCNPNREISTLGRHVMPSGLGPGQSLHFSVRTVAPISRAEVFSKNPERDFGSCTLF